ncbi:uncharacterized protein LOC120635760 [Pararge aegeria]|uniref:uncharacterized protein LOC120635760 n=1 Tax=Pararge aegeria TaxID=116150 RepID=UPI0019D30F63|nr:uncharacterized protein LOC120635760 [Pararge aegeria]
MFAKRFVLVMVNFYLNVNFTNAFSKILLKIEDPDAISNDYYESFIDKTDYRNFRTYDDLELISKALEIIKKEKSDSTALEINKCLDVVNMKKKLNCIKRLIYKEKSDSDNKKPYFYTKLFNDEPFPLMKYKHNLDNGFVDLTKSGNDAKRTFHTLFKFSDDYLDINDLLRAGTEMVDEKSIAPNKIKILDEAQSLRQLKNFSQDYLDVNDILRTSKNAKSTPERIDNEKAKMNVYVFKLLPIKEGVKIMRRYRTIDTKGNENKNILRSASEENDSSSSSESSESKEERVIRKGKKWKRPKRFQVINKSVEEDVSSEEDSSNESDIPIQRPIEVPKRGKKMVFYMQAPGRIYKTEKESRRRLPHFFPKRYHWNEEEMKDLRDYWFNGPQGKYRGHYKTPY